MRTERIRAVLRGQINIDLSFSQLNLLLVQIHEAIDRRREYLFLSFVSHLLVVLLEILLRWDVVNIPLDLVEVRRQVLDDLPRSTGPHENGAIVGNQNREVGLCVDAQVVHAVQVQLDGHEAARFARFSVHRVDADLIGALLT